MLAMTTRHREHLLAGSLLRRDAATNTRDACATQQNPAFVAAPLEDWESSAKGGKNA
jgi:hypothetical protein